MVHELTRDDGWDADGRPRRLRAGGDAARARNTRRRERVVRAGDPLVLVDRPHPRWTVAIASELLRPGNGREAEAAALAELPELADAWRAVLHYRLDHGDIGSDEARLVGPNA
jgi:hypothetical protein